MHILFIFSSLLLLSEGSLIGAPEARHDVQKDWWESAIFYQIYPRSFKDSNGDGIGDIQGIISKLEHLKDIGVTGTWLSPIFKSPMVDFGYDIQDFYSVDATFGTMEDLQELFTKAKELDIKIILDFVPNHSSNLSDWFLNSINRTGKYEDYYVWRNASGIDENGDPIPPNNWQSVFYGSAWEWNEERGQFYLHQFDKSQPDLNFRNPDVVDEMKNVLRYWLDLGASGFRVDAINHLMEIQTFENEPINNPSDPLSYAYTHHIYTKDLDEMYEVIYDWRVFLDEYTSENGGDTRIMMTEAYANTSFTMKYYQSPQNSLRLGSHLPFNFVLINEVRGDSTPNDFKRIIDERLTALPIGRVTNWVIGNHDQQRYTSRFGIHKADILLALVMTLPGVAVTYNGEEIGMIDNRDGITWEQTKDPQACNGRPEDYISNSRDPERTPFQWDDTTNAGFTSGQETWLPVHPNYVTLNLERQKNFQKRSIYNFYKELSALRTNHILIDGDYELRVVNNGNVLVLRRTLEPHGTLVTLMNFGTFEEYVNITQITNTLGEWVEVVAAGSETLLYNVGDVTTAESFYMRQYDVVVVQQGGASTIYVSVLLSICSVILSILRM